MSRSDFQFVLLSWLDGLVGWGWVAKKACTLSLRPPSLFLQLSNPLPNSPGTPTHLGHPHGQLSLSTLVHQSPQVHQPQKLFKSLRQLQVFGLLLRNLVHKFRPRSTSASFASFIEKTSWMAQVLKLSITIIHSGLVAKRGNMLLVQRGAKLQKSKRAKLQKPTSNDEGNQSS